jgi:hypothetical protein
MTAKPSALVGQINFHIEEAKRAKFAHESARKIYVKASLATFRKIGHARKECPANQQFGAWLEASGVKLGKTERAAVIRLAEHIAITEEIIADVDCWSWERLWTQHVQPRTPQPRQPRVPRPRNTAPQTDARQSTITTLTTVATPARIASPSTAPDNVQVSDERAEPHPATGPCPRLGFVPRHQSRAGEHESIQRLSQRALYQKPSCTARRPRSAHSAN